jgi:hypothetical protein
VPPGKSRLATKKTEPGGLEFQEARLRRLHRVNIFAGLVIRSTKIDCDDNESDNYAR